MSITSLSDDLNIISSLPDSPSSPTYTAQTLKQKFDQAGNMIKNYINNVLIPGISDEISNVVLGESVYEYIPTKKLIASFKTAGTYTFDTAQFPSLGGLYDIIMIGAGGGGYYAQLPYCGGGAGDAVKKENIKLNGVYTITVGAAGAPGSDGSGTFFYCEDTDDYIGYAMGGATPTPFSKIGYGRGVCGGDSVFGDGSAGYGHGGDCYGYGKGARGGALADDVVPAVGYGGGGWGSVYGGGGAVFIYGYVKGE